MRDRKMQPRRMPGLPLDMRNVRGLRMHRTLPLDALIMRRDAIARYRIRAILVWRFGCRL